MTINLKIKILFKQKFKVFVNKKNLVQEKELNHDERGQKANNKSLPMDIRKAFEDKSRHIINNNNLFSIFNENDVILSK